MTWHDIMTFVDGRDPDYRKTLEGVSADSIALCEGGLGVVLPRLYTDFLLTMGAETGRFRPFGASQCSNFYELVEELPPEDYSAERYFKVSFETDSSLIVHYDHFLDLSRADGEDAPLVRFERGEVDPQDIMDVGFTLGEMFSRGMFNVFELDRHPYAQGLGLVSEPGERGELQIRAVVTILQHMRLQPVLPPLPRVACVRRGELSALFEVYASTKSLGIYFGADDRDTVAIAIEQFCGAFPSAYVRGPMKVPEMT